MHRPEAIDPTTPTLDEDGLLRHGGRWIAISNAQLPVVALLVSRAGRLVRVSEIRAAHVQAGGSADPSSLRSLVRRVRHRLAELGLELRSVSGQGFVLGLPETSPMG